MAQNTCDAPGTLISLSTTGQNTSAGYLTTYVLTNASGVILQTVGNTFNAPNTPGNYKVYTVNYDATQTNPSFTAGININAIGGACVAVGTNPLLFAVCSPCDAPGTTISFTTNNQNTTSGFITRYFLTNNSNVILNEVTSPFNLPTMVGNYKVYTINYDGAGTIPTLTAGTNIAAIGGSCTAVGAPMFFSVCPISIAGNVFQDAGGLLTDATVNGTGENISNALYANLLSGGAVVQSVLVANDGTYTFPNVTANTTYTVIVATSATATTPNLPTGWVNTGENIGTAAGNDGTINGTITVAVATSNITNVNFGIEQTPSAATITQATQLNPMGMVQATVAAATFGGTDPDGTVTGLMITAFPTNTTSIVVNGVTYNANVPSEVAALLALVIPTNAAGEPTQAITLDPIDGAVTAVIPYITVDNAGFAGTAGVANVPFSAAVSMLNIAGTIFQDNNALTDNIVNGVGTNAGGALYANLLSGGMIVMSVPVANNGTYNFAGVTANTNYTVVLTTSAAATGANLPSGYLNTGEGTAAAGDGTVDGVTTVAVATSSITGVNFGIKQSCEPANTSVSFVITGNNTSAGFVTVSLLTNSAGVIIQQVTSPFNLPNMGGDYMVHTVNYDGAGTIPTLTAGTNIAAIGGSCTAVGAPMFFSVCPISIAGNVFHDAGGLLTDATVNGTGENISNTLYANLLSGGVVVQSVLVANDGTYTFPNVTANTSYTVIVAASATATTPNLPTGWVNTGENIGTAAGNDGTVNGTITVAVATSNIANVNFGIEQTPSAATLTQAVQPNTGGTTQEMVAATTFGGTDPDGTVTGLMITAFPTNTTSIVVNGVTYNANVPSEVAALLALVIPTNAAGEPTQTITLDPIDGAVTAVIPYITVDNAGFTGTAGVANVPFSAPISIAGNVFHDAGGLLTDATVNGTGENISNTLYANLLDGGVVVQSVLVANDGTYTFPNVTANTTYTVIVATSATATTPNLPTGWVNTGENIGTAAGNDGTVNGTITVAVATSNITNINFGIEQTPNAATLTQAVQPNTGGTTQEMVAATTFGGTDPDGTVTGLMITAFPTNTTSIVVNGVTYNANVPSEVAALLALVIPTNAAGEPTQTITLDPIDGAVTAVIPYITVDNAGFTGTAGVANVPFSVIAATGAIGSRVWLDEGAGANAQNGIQDADEVGISGVTVTLYNNTGKVVAATKTDAYGNYVFTNIVAGDYTVGFSLPINYAFTTAGIGTDSGTATDSDVDNIATSATFGRSNTIALSAGETDVNVDAGIYCSQSNTQSIGDLVWFDADNDGVQDAGEKGISDVSVTLYDLIGNAITTTLTDGNGFYLFDNLPTGSYIIGFGEMVGLSLTTQVTGTATGSDADPITKQTGVITLNQGDKITDIDAGFVPIASSKCALGGNAWFDTDNNGIQNTPSLGGATAGNESAVPNVTVKLYDATNTLVATQVTDVFGNYIFNNLDAGRYYVVFEPSTLPAAYVFSPQNTNTGLANDANDSDANTTNGATAWYSLAPGDKNLTVDAGIYKAAANTGGIGDFVWFDTNKDGIQNDSPFGGAGGGGVTVVLYAADGTTEVARTVSNSVGFYAFNNLPAADYVVAFSNLPQGFVFTTPNAAGSTAANNSDAIPFGTNGAAKTGLISVTTTFVNNVDVGIYPSGNPSGTGSIGNFVWIDTDNNGVQNSGEVGVSGVTVNLLDATTNAIIATQKTDAEGRYLFTGLDAGDYKVQFVTASLPAGYDFVAQNAGANDAIDSDCLPSFGGVGGGLTNTITLTKGQDNLSVAAGIHTPNTTRGSIGNFVWNDLDGDGMQEPTELGVRGISVRLLDATTGALIAVTTTNRNGGYLFPDLPYGAYVVEMGDLPQGYTFATPNNTTNSGDDTNDSDFIPYSGGAGGGLGTARTATIVIDATTSHNTDTDAGIRSTTKAGLGDYVWFDTDGNGQQDAGENPIAGVLVALYDAATSLRVATAITDENGYYSFLNLDPDVNYRLGFENTPLGARFTKTTANTINGSDADADTGMTPVVDLVAGTYNSNIDAGVSVLKAGLGDYVWIDMNGDGIQNDVPPTGGAGGGSTGLAGVLVTLYNATTNTVVAKTMTDGTGYYSFTNLNPGDYYVAFDATTLPKGGVFATQNAVGSTAANGSDVNAAGVSATITLAAGEFNADIDAGVQLTKGSLGDFVWLDTNQNGIQDACNDPSGTGCEQPLAGVTVSLYNATDLNTVIATTTTNANGAYWFMDLPQGDYVVKFDAFAGHSRSTTAGTVAGNATDTPLMNSDANAIDGTTLPITLTLGARNGTTDAGYHVTTLPIKLLYFKQAVNGCEVRLDWATASEQNSKSFAVWRSTDEGKTWTKLATLAAAGNSNNFRAYTFTDTKPNRANSYKLVQTDFDGHSETFTMLNKITTNGCFEETDNGISGLYPNPNGTNEVNVKFYTNRNDTENVDFVIYDVLGRTVAIYPVTIVRGANVLQLDISNLPSGAYTVKAVGEGWYSVAQKLIRIKE